MQTVKYFMWGFQHAFRGAASVMWDTICNRAGCRIRGDIFLVGFRAGDGNGVHPICVEPDTCSFQPTDFENVPANAAKALEEPREFIYTHPSAWHYEHYESRYRGECLRDAIVDAVLAKNVGSDRRTFCSEVVQVDNYRVALILLLDGDDIDACPHLATTYGEKVHSTGIPPVHRSFIVTLINEFLSFCGEELSKPHPGSAVLFQRDVSELAREAGRLFMNTVALAGHGYRGISGLFESCCKVASLRYEGADGIGTVVIARRDHPSVIPQVILEKPVDLSDAHSTRKVLEISRGSLCLLSDSAVIYGLGEVSAEGQREAEDVVLIRFVRHHVWEAVNRSRVLVRVSYGDPAFLRERFDESKLRDVLRRVVPTQSGMDLDHLVALSHAASERGRGTMLVISPRAAQEAARLGMQCLPVRPFRMTPELLERMTAIDGAILLAPDGTCVAIGAILDGRATWKGNPARGARYNSAVRYTEQELDTVALVVSEDGMVDVLPNLRPAIRHSELENQIQLLEAQAAAETLDQGRCWRLIKFLDELRYYLREPECARINAAWKAIDPRLEREGVRPVYDDFAALPEVDERNFVPE